MPRRVSAFLDSTRTTYFSRSAFNQSKNPLKFPTQPLLCFLFRNKDSSISISIVFPSSPTPPNSSQLPTRIFHKLHEILHTIKKLYFYLVSLLVLLFSAMFYCTKNIQVKLFSILADGSLRKCC